MGLFDSVLGSVLGGGSAQGGLGGLLGSVLSNPQAQSGLTSALGSILGDDGSHGGLGGLVQKFNEAGLGEHVASWIGSGQNLPISADQISQVLGSDAVAGIAAKLGIDPQTASGVLSSVLPGVINHLTPNGQAPAAGLGNSSDLMGLLGGLLNKA